MTRARAATPEPAWLNHFFFSRSAGVAHSKLHEFATQHKSRLIQSNCALLQPSDLLEIAKESVPHRFIVIDSVHHLARRSASMERYYRELLETCNYLASTRSIYVVGNDVGVPALFLKENLRLDLWRFVDCDLSGDEPNKVRFAPATDWQRSMLISAAQLRSVTAQEFQATAECSSLFSCISECEALLNAPPYLVPTHQHPTSSDMQPPDCYALQARMQARIVGQDEAIRRLAESVQVAFSPLLEDYRPRMVTLLVGSSGVGKTEMCRQLADFLPGYKFLQINLAEHSDRSAVDKLIGLGRGYEDSEYGGVLTEPVRQHSRQVVLFDELDHADKSVVQLLYKVLEGEITDGRGRAISFRDCLIVMTTNMGVTGNAAAERHTIEGVLRQQRPDLFTLAFLGRIPSIIECRQLTPNNYVEIARRYFASRLVSPYASHGMEVTCRSTIRPGLLDAGCLSPQSLLCELLAIAAGMSSDQGARRLLQVIDEYVIRPIELCRVTAPQPITHVSILVSPYLPNIDGLQYDRARLLIIDDDAHAKAFMQSQTEGLPIEISQCGFGADEVKRALSERPGGLAVGVVLLDLMEGPRTDSGRILFESLRPEFKGYPVCLLSGLPRGPRLAREIVPKLEVAGFAGYLSKNEERRTIRDKIAELLQQRYFDAKVEASAGSARLLKTTLPSEHSEHLVVEVAMELRSQ